jgi:carbon monoxide dehydrogenase subunit G
MLKIESKTGLVKGSQEAVYHYITDFRNFDHMLPADRLRNLKVSDDTIRFGIDGLGTVGLKISEKKPCSQLTVTATDDSSADFTFRFHIVSLSDQESEVKLVLQANLNMFLEMMAKGPLQQFVDLMIDKLAQVEFVR